MQTSRYVYLIQPLWSNELFNKNRQYFAVKRGSAALIDVETRKESVEATYVTTDDHGTKRIIMENSIKILEKIDLNEILEMDF